METWDKISWSGEIIFFFFPTNVTGEICHIHMYVVFFSVNKMLKPRKESNVKRKSGLIVKTIAILIELS